MRTNLAGVCLAAACLCSAACRPVSSPKSDAPSIVGTWLVKSPGAPFPYHMFAFHSDGTMQQSNPDAGDSNTSDSDGMGVWASDANGIRGKFVEVTADRNTRQFVSRGEISFSIRVNGDRFSGSASALFFDVDGRKLKGPLAVTLEGQRITP